MKKVKVIGRHLVKYNPGQPRDDHGRWTSGGGAGGAGGGGNAAGVSRYELNLNAGTQALNEYTALRSQAEQLKASFDEGLDTGNGIDKVIGANAANTASFEDFKAAIESPGATVIMTPVKPDKSARRKMAKKGGDAAKLKDLVRGTVAVQKDSEIAGAVRAAKQEMTKRGWELAEIEDRLTTPMDTGYSDVQSIWRHKETGHLAELQFNTKSMIKAKEFEGGHKLYEEHRLLEPLAEAGTISQPQKARMQELEAEMSTLYANARKRSW